MDIKKIVINKNRGWRGLAELDCIDTDGNTITKMIFSFSQPVWEDMLKGYIVLQEQDKYIILNFDNLDKLPKPTQQRSVLIKSVLANVVNKYTYEKDGWAQPALAHGHYDFIYNYIKNRNNHTTSDWNCIGIRVVPMI